MGPQAPRRGAATQSRAADAPSPQPRSVLSTDPAVAAEQERQGNTAAETPGAASAYENSSSRRLTCSESEAPPLRESGVALTSLPGFKCTGWGGLVG